MGLATDFKSKTNLSAQEEGKKEKRPGCHALNSTLPALRPEKARLAPTSRPVSCNQTHRAELVRVPPNSSPLPQSQEQGRPESLRQSFRSFPAQTGWGDPCAQSQLPELSERNRNPAPSPARHSLASPAATAAVSPRSATAPIQGRPPPQLATPVGSGAQEGITSVASQPLSATRGRLVPVEAEARSSGNLRAKGASPVTLREYRPI